MLKRSFEDILENLKDSIADYKYYVSFEKVLKNVKTHNKNLKLLNELIGSETIEYDFKNLIEKNPQIVTSIPALLATRKKHLQILDDKIVEYNFDNNFPTNIENYIIFMQKTGLFDLLKNKQIHDLRDYYLGIEVGMDTNARKNRIGHTMENIVENFIIKAKPEEFYREINKEKILSKFNINLQDLISKKTFKKESEKRFDFVVKNHDEIFLIETNFYSSSGSKLNEVARSYTSLNNTLKNLPNIHFVWITDGKGWNKAKNNFKEAYDSINHLYSLYDLENGVLEKLFSN